MKDYVLIQDSIGVLTFSANKTGPCCPPKCLQQS